MITSHPTCLWLAQADTKPSVLVDRDKLQEVSRHINDGIQHDMPWELLLVGIGATILTVAVVSLRRWWLKRYKDPSPLELYSAIARKAGLGWRDRLLLWRISRTFKLPTPITLLLARGTLRHYADRYARHRSITSRAKLYARLSHIESELFG